MEKDVVLAFVEAINKQEVKRITQMMADDFWFVDTYGGRMDKAHMETGWQGYFDWFPDYRITVEDYLANDACAVVLGKASASYLGRADRHWEFPAAWKAVVSGKQLKLWQVYCDSKKQLDSMRENAE